MTGQSRWCATLCGCLLGWVLCGVAMAEGPSRGMPKRGLPAWQEGDWWVVSADILTDDRLVNPEKKGKLVSASLPDDRGVFSVETRFQVEKPTIVKREVCDVISIRVHRLPSWLKDETEGEPLWKLFIRKSDGTLAKYEWKLRQWPFVAGEVQSVGSRELKEHMPVAHSMAGLVPLDVPLLSHPLGEIRPLYDRQKVLTYDKDEWTAHPRKETIEVYEDRVLGKKQKVVVITIWGPDIGFRRQVWVPGYPWWVEWSQMDQDGLVRSGILRARMVAFGNRARGRKVIADPGTPVSKPVEAIE